MGNWSPYSEEWEKAHVESVLDIAAEECVHNKAVFEGLPRPVQALIKAGQTARYYLDIALIQIRKRIDRKYREEMEAGVAQLKGMLGTVACRSESTPQSPRQNQ